MLFIFFHLLTGLLVWIFEAPYIFWECIRQTKLFLLIYFSTKLLWTQIHCHGFHFWADNPGPILNQKEIDTKTAKQIPLLMSFVNCAQIYPGKLEFSRALPFFMVLMWDWVHLTWCYLTHLALSQCSNCSF